MRTSLEPRPPRKLLRLLCILVFSLGAVGFILLRTLPDSGVKHHVSAIRQAGLPTSSVEVDAWYQPVPKEENAALLVCDAMLEHVSPGNSISLATLPLSGSELDPELAAELAAHLEKNRAALDLLHAAAKLPKSRYPVDFTAGPDTLLPHLAKIKGLAQLLRYEAVYESSQGNHEEACTSVTSGFALAHTLRDEPTLIAQLVRIACVAVALDSLEKVLSADPGSARLVPSSTTLPHPLTDAQLQTLDRLLLEADADGVTGIFRALVGERAGIISFMTGDRPYFWDVVGGNTNRNPVFKKLGWGIQRALGFHQRDLNLCLEGAGRFIEIVTNGFPGAVQRSEEVKRDIDSRLDSGLARFAGITRVTVPSWSKAITKVAALNTQVRCARLALAVERYRLAHGGALPPALTALVPNYIPALPVDPVVGEDFNFTRRPEQGYWITSPIAGEILNNKRQAQFGVYR